MARKDAVTLQSLLPLIEYARACSTPDIGQQVAVIQLLVP